MSRLRDKRQRLYLGGKDLKLQSFWIYFSFYCKSALKIHQHFPFCQHIHIFLYLQLHSYLNENVHWEILTIKSKEILF